MLVARAQYNDATILYISQGSREAYSWSPSSTSSTAALETPSLFSVLESGFLFVWLVFSFLFVHLFYFLNSTSGWNPMVSVFLWLGLVPFSLYPLGPSKWSTLQMARVHSRRQPFSYVLNRPYDSYPVPKSCFSNPSQLSESHHHLPSGSSWKTLDSPLSLSHLLLILLP